MSNIFRGPIPSREECAGCPLARDGVAEKPVRGIGPKNPKFIVIGEGPGFNEQRQGVPFVGESGQLLDRAFRYLGINRKELYVTNTTLCLDGRTQVRLADGSAKRIDMLVKARYAGEVLSVATNGEFVRRRVTGWHRNERAGREIRRVVFDHARVNVNGPARMLATEDHPVYTPDGWVNAADVGGGLIATGEPMLVGRGAQILFGTILGDGCVTAAGYFRLSHAEDQAEYLHAKATAISQLGARGGVETPRHGWQAKHYVETRASAWMRVLREKFYVNGRKRIPQDVLDEATDLLFAVWYFDDGRMSFRPGRRPRAEIAGTGYLAEDLERAAAALRKRGLECTTRDGRIHFGVDVVPELSRRFAPYAPPCMAYKLMPEHRTLWQPTTYEAAPIVPFFDRAESRLVEVQGDGVVYCIDVEDTHNFVTLGGVVHNCVPNRSAGDKEKMVTDAARFCKGRLEAELAEVSKEGKPPLLLLGAHASRAFIGDEFRITELAGAYHEIDGWRMIPTIHPAAILRGSGSGGGHNSDLGFINLAFDINKVNDLAKGEAEPYPITFEVVTKPGRARRVLEMLTADVKECGFFACDTETRPVAKEECTDCYACDGHSALEPRQARLKVIGFATPKRAFSFLWDAIDAAAFAQIDALFSDEKVVKVFHNKGYDVPVLDCHGFTIRGRVECTQLAHHSAFPGMDHKLQRVTTQFFLAPPWKSEFRKNHGTAKKRKKGAA